MRQLLQIKIPGDPNYIKVAKLAVAATLTEVGFSYEEIEDMKMAVAEACRSITCHGHDRWVEFYELNCFEEDNKVVIDISSLRFDYNIEKNRKPCLDCPREGDLGIKIIESLVDEIEIDRAGEGCVSIKLVKEIC